jgi:hypothetical protein
MLSFRLFARGRLPAKSYRSIEQKQCRFQTDCRHRAIRNACFTPDVDIGRLFAGNVALSATAARPASKH